MLFAPSILLGCSLSHLPALAGRGVQRFKCIYRGSAGPILHGKTPLHEYALFGFHTRGSCIGAADLPSPQLSASTGPFLKAPTPAPSAPRRRRAAHLKNPAAMAGDSEPPSKARCAGADCQNEAGALQCPTCLKLGLKDSSFCSQDCFKRNWVSLHVFSLLGRLPDRGVVERA